MLVESPDLDLAAAQYAASLKQLRVRLLYWISFTLDSGLTDIQRRWCLETQS
jgi:hypothetical protein